MLEALGSGLGAVEDLLEPGPAERGAEGVDARLRSALALLCGTGGTGRPKASLGGVGRRKPLGVRLRPRSAEDENEELGRPRAGLSPVGGRDRRPVEALRIIDAWRAEVAALRALRLTRSLLALRSVSSCCSRARQRWRVAS